MNAYPLWPLAVYAFLVVLVAAGMLGLSALLGSRHLERDTGQPYESGIVSIGSARLRFDVQFYLMAMFFVAFDLEAMFIFAWAVALRSVGWLGFAEMALFIGVLLATLAYLWRDGALDWAPEKKRAARRRVRGDSSEV